MKKKLFTFLKTCFLFICAGLTTNNVQAINLETYIESWDSQYTTALYGMPLDPSNQQNSAYKGVVLDIAFGAYVFPGLKGLQFTQPNNVDVKNTIMYVHEQGGKIKISYGGASYAQPFYPNYFISQTTAAGGWPKNINYLADGIRDVVNANYGNGAYFDGIDFDIEDPQPTYANAQTFAQDLFTFLKAVRSRLPGKIISLTVPAQGWGTYWEHLVKLAGAPGGPVDYINFMEYDIWVTPEVSYRDQILGDILTYTSSVKQSLAPNNTPGWGLDPAKIQIGMMIANDDLGQNLSVNDTVYITQTAMSSQMFGKPLYGVMTWDLNRDALTDLNPLPTRLTPPAFQFITAIRKQLATPVTPTFRLATISTRTRLMSRPLTVFERQSPPPHGAPKVKIK